MTVIYILAWIAALLAWLNVVPPVAWLPALFLFPGQALLVACHSPRSRDSHWALGPALSPVVVGLVTVAMLWLHLHEAVLAGVMLGCGAVVILASVRRRRTTAGDATDQASPLAWAVGLAFAVLVGVLLAGEWRRINSDAWFHIAVISEIERAGLPPQDPYFAGLQLQYFWFFHAAVYGLRKLTGLDPGMVMALLNVLGVTLVVPMAARVVRRLGGSPAQGVWAGVLFLLGLGGLGLLVIPAKLLTTVVGETRGMDQVREMFDIFPLTEVTTAVLVQFLQSGSFLLKKFLVGTAASWCFLLVLVAADAALAAVRYRQRSQEAILFFASLGAFLFHVILGGAMLAALGGAAGMLGMFQRERRGVLLRSAGWIVLSFVVCLPYLAVCTRGKEGDNLFPLGVDLLSWALLPITLGGVTVLSLPAVRHLWTHRTPERVLMLGWTAFAAGYAVFARLPGPNQFDKPPLVLYTPLALLAGMSIPLLWHRFAGKRMQVVFAVLLVLFLVPENTFRYLGYVADRHAPAMTDAEEALYAWIRTETPRDAIFVDSNDRVEILVRGPRRQYWGKEPYAVMWGYNAEEMDTRRGVLAAIYHERPFAVMAPQKLLELSAPAYIVARDRDVPGIDGVLSHAEGLLPVFHADGITVYQVTEITP